MRIDPAKTQKEPTYQVVLDALALTTCYPVFLITADVLEIYMCPFWFTINKHDSSYRFKIGKKRFTIDMEVFKEIFQNALDFQLKSLMHFHQMKKLSPLLRNLATNETLNLSLKLMTNQQMRDSTTYNTYLAYATSAASPKLKRKFKKPASLSKKRTLVTVEEEEHELAKKKKAPSKTERSKGIELLSDAALLKEAQLKKALKRTKREKNIHQAGGSSEGADFESEVPNEPKGKSIDTSEGIGLKPGVPNVSKGDSSESEYESWGDSADETNLQDDEDVQDSNDEPQHADDERTDSENQETNDDEEETKDEFVHTPPNYVPNDDEMNDESNDVNEEEYERINEELYGDANISLTDAESADKEKDDDEMTDAGHVHVVVENVDQVGADINVQHEVPRTSSLLTIPVSLIPEEDVINQSETATTTPAPTISSLISSLYPALQQIVPIPTLTTTEATTSTTVVPNSETLAALQLRVTNMEKDVKELKDVDNSTKKNFPDIIKEHSVPAKTVERLRQQYTPQKSVEDIQEIKMEHARKQQEPKETITSSDTTALEEFDQKTTLFKIMTKSKSFNKSPKQRALYHALIESILEDEDAMDEGVADKLKKRKQDDADKDKGPFAGSDQGLKRQKTSKDTKPSKKAKSTETSKGTSKSQPKSAVKSAHAEETVFEAGDTQEPWNQG
ncbi:hypothetical protein Tco_0980862 [Tanacetum coccineum]